MIFLETKRSNLDPTEFGIPKDRKFPLDSAEHVKSAIRLFGHAKESDKKSLARRIKKAADRYDIDIPDTTQVYKYLNEECTVEKVTDEINNAIKTETSLASINPIIGTVKPYVLKVHDNVGESKNNYSMCEFAIAADLIPEKYMIVNNESKLEIVGNSDLLNSNLEVYKFVGDSRMLGKLAKAYKEQNTVDSTFIYSVLSGKELLTEDQIDFDDNFDKVDVELIAEIRNTIGETLKYQLNINGFPAHCIIAEGMIIDSKLRHDIRENKELELIQDDNGYRVHSNITGLYSRCVKLESQITDQMIKSVLTINV